MPRRSLKLTEARIKAARPRADGKPLKLSDGDGLDLWLQPNGSRHWRYRYATGGRERLLALGPYPAVSLKEARRLRDEAKRQRAAGQDPLESRKEAKRAARLAIGGSFEEVAREWLAKQGRLGEGTLDKATRALERDIFPELGDKLIGSITAPQLLEALRKVEARGRLETAARLRQRCGQIFRYAIATGRAERDPAADLRDALATAKTRHHAAIVEPEKVGQLLRALDAYDGQFITLCALRLAPLVFVRPGELRHAEWAEIDLDKAEWRIPAEKMKMRELHIVPLSRQAVEILLELQKVTGRGRYVFPSVRSWRRPMSENTVTAALRRLGYGKDEATAHGFRSTASTLLHELGFNRDWIERQLAHGERNQVRAAYNYAAHLPDRRRMMQAWADYLDTLRAGKADKVVPIRHGA